MVDTQKEIFKQIKRITSLLISSSFSVRQNFPSDKDNRIAWSGYKDISFALKNISYSELYEECIKESAYNFMLLDGAIIQMMYEFNNNEVIRHRLAFYPNPSIERFQDAVEDFEKLYYGDQLFADIFDKKVITFPLRFDFDSDQEKYVEFDHSFAHLTFGNYKNCRIPVSKVISPNKFILFILRSFYFDRFIKYYNNSNFICDLSFNELLSANEKKQIFIGV